MSPIADAARRLEAISDSPLLDTELLLAHALGINREQLLLRPPAEVPAEFEALLARRLAGEPIAYIIGARAFWTIELEVAPDVLIPRPDSETLIEAAVAHFGDCAPTQILDLGTGPGTLLLAALAQWPEAQGLGIDSSETALHYARRNADDLGLADRAHFARGDWARGVDGPFDLILANPPYIATDEPLPPDVREFEPHGALYAGADGLDAHRAIIPDLPRLLAPGGTAVLEIGWTQADPVLSLVRITGLVGVLKYDLERHARALAVS